jgi:hypothetical protein
MYIKSHEIRKSICRFRISAHDLTIETGRYGSVKNNAGQRIPLERSKTICLMCNQNCIEDEYHFLTDNIYSGETEFFMISHNLTKSAYYYQKETIFRSPELKAQVSFSDRPLYSVRLSFRLSVRL